MREYDGDLSKATAFVTTQEADEVEAELIEFFNANGISYTLSNKAWKINFTRVKESEDHVKEGA